MALLQVFLALLVLIVTADVFVSVRAKRNMQDICQNGSLTKNINASRFAAWIISEGNLNVFRTNVRILSKFMELGDL